MATSDSSRNRQRRTTFWLDERLIDEFAPVMGRYPFGTAALAVYVVLARRAGHHGNSWPRLHLIALQVGTSERTVQRAIHLLELLGLVEVTSCFEEGSKRQTSNLYTLLPLPLRLPEVDPDPQQWPRPHRATLAVRPGQRSQSVTDARQQEKTAPSTEATHRQQVTQSPPRLTPRPRRTVTPYPVSLTPQEAVPSPKHNPVKDLSGIRSFTIAEVGLTNGQVWAATLAELAHRGAVSATDLEAWLRPAALIGRDGDALVIGTPNGVARDRIANRLLPAVSAALTQVLGMALPIVVRISAAAPSASEPAVQPGHGRPAAAPEGSKVLA